MSLCNLFCQSIRWQIGNENDINFLANNQLFQPTLLLIIQPLTNNLHLKVSDFISFDGCQDRSMLDSYLLNVLVDQICSIFLPSNHQSDALVWRLRFDGDCLVESGALLA